jgi:hypothetical protein
LSGSCFSVLSFGLRFNSDDFTARDVGKLSPWTALIASQGNPMSILTEDIMKQSQNFLESADNCGQLAERAADEPTYNRYKRMEAAWKPHGGLWPLSKTG